MGYLQSMEEWLGQLLVSSPLPLTRSLRELQNQAVNAEDRDPRDVVHIKRHRQNLAGHHLPI